MENHLLPRLIFFSCVLLRYTFPAAADNCPTTSCGPNEPPIRYPFRIAGRQSYWCGYPGFSVTCDKQNRTIIRLPPSRSYIVNRISYLSQVIHIKSNFCRQNEIRSFNLANTPFDYGSLRNYTFYNCSVRNLGFMYEAVQFHCLSSANYSVFGGQGEFFSPRNIPSNCKVMKTIEVPWLNGDISSEMELTWLTPSCRSSEMEGRDCGWNDNGQTVGLGSSSGFSTGAKYGVGLGIGMPVSISLIGLVCYSACKRNSNSESSLHRQGIDVFSIAIITQPPPRTGLDVSTIELYPKTTLGESCRLPDDDSTCAICLSDYKPKESLRMIPECNHYFHVECIDEWLKLNATCPVCRNTPESSSLVTSCSVTSTTSVDTS